MHHFLSVWTKRVSAAHGAGAAHAAAGQVGRAAPARASGEGGAFGVSAAAGQCTITGFQASTGVHCAQVSQPGHGLCDQPDVPGVQGGHARGPGGGQVGHLLPVPLL